MVTIAEYLSQRNTPMPNSPTGRAMVELLAVAPNLTFEKARELVNQVGASMYSSPRECAKAAAKLLQNAKAA